MFVVIDGPNGSGKTSLIKKMSNKGYRTLSSPNGTPLAKLLRPACRGVEPWEDIDKTIQFLLFSAARFDEYVRQIHNQDEIVIADRWWTSTYVYQCILQGLSVDFLEHTIHEQEKIDLVILLDAKQETLEARVESERASNPDHKKCTWTRDVEKCKKLASIYRNELPQYLSSRDIPCKKIDTTEIGIDELPYIVEETINNHYEKGTQDGTA